MVRTIATLMITTLRRREGVTALEYAVIAGVAAVTLAAAFTGFYDALETALGTVLPGGGGAPPPAGG